jgi:lambda family phage minor tail protein L
MADSITTQQAQSSIKSLVFELNNLTPSAIVTLFEIDLTSILEAKSIPDLSAAKVQTGFNQATPDNTLRFHNNIKVFDSTIIWQGNTYIPAPIQATGFENSSRGTLPTPILSISSQSETGTDQLALLRYEILKLGDIIGAKVTRRRTFAKYLDWENFKATTSGPRLAELPDGYEPDPNAELPKDIYFIERKTSENKNTIQYQLSSILDLEGIKIPQRTIISDKCNWNYRGPGCWYQHQEGAGGDNAENPVPILQKADLRTGDIILPKDAPPVANDKDERIAGLLETSHNILATDNDMNLWNSEVTYVKNNYVYIIKDKIKYYFVAKADVLVNTPPPNATYWIADECSKTLNGCRLRWGAGGSVSQGACKIGNFFNGDANNPSGGLPFGGFPAARKVSQMQ